MYNQIYILPYSVIKMEINDVAYKQIIKRKKL